MIWNSTKDTLPPEKRFVLIHVTKNNWISKDDPDGVYYTVACFYGGYWHCFGPGSYDKNEVDYWAEIERLKK